MIANVLSFLNVAPSTTMLPYVPFTSSLFTSVKRRYALDRSSRMVLSVQTMTPALRSLLIRLGTGDAGPRTRSERFGFTPWERKCACSSARVVDTFALSSATST